MAASIRYFVIIILCGIITLSIHIGYYHYKKYTYKQLTKSAILKPVKVFQIGFSKCGTTTLAEFFNKNGIPAIHHDFGHLATSIFHNASNSLPLISPQYLHYTVFTDMERMYEYPPLNVPVGLFKELDRQYPGSKFIFNIRNKDAWLQSRAKHHIGSQRGPTLLALNAHMLNLSEEQVLALWSAEWDAHFNEVLEHFKNRPQDLLIFDIEQDNPEKLCAFFKDYFVLNAKYYRHSNKGNSKLLDEKVPQKEFFHKIYN